MSEDFQRLAEQVAALVDARLGQRLVGVEARLQDFEQRFDNQANQLSALRLAVEPLQKQIENQARDLEGLALDMKIVREHGRRDGGIGAYRRTPIQSDDETDGNGHSSYPWKQRPATPRPG